MSKQLPLVTLSHALSRSLGPVNIMHGHIPAFHTHPCTYWILYPHLEVRYTAQEARSTPLNLPGKSIATVYHLLTLKCAHKYSHQLLQKLDSSYCKAHLFQHACDQSTSLTSIQREIAVKISLAGSYKHR